MQHILIVIPTYNEAENIQPLVSAIETVFDWQTAIRADILFVDDCSPDGTADVIQSLKTKLRIRLLSGRRAGLGNAYIRGLSRGLRRGTYDAFVMMDADLSHDPADIPRLLTAIDHGADYVIGSRYAIGGTVAAGYSPRRQFQSRAANWLARTLIDVPAPPHDLTAGFKAIRASALRTVPLQAIQASGYVFQVSLLYEFMKRGYQVREVSTVFHSRRRGVSKLGWHDILEFVIATYRLNPSARLQRMIRFGIVGASGTIVNLLILLALVHLAGWQPQYAYIAALEGSIISNFILNHLVTFRYSQTGGRWHGFARKLAIYNGVALIGAAIAWGAFSICTRAFGVHYILADLVGVLLAMSWNYWLSVRLVWPLADNEPVEMTTVRQHDLQKT